MGPPPDAEQMINMLQNPQFQSTMNEALQNPQLIDMMIQQNPMLRDMGPGVRQMMQSPYFRRMMTDPESLRSITQMQRAMNMGPFGQAGGGGNAAFPAPGVTNTTAAENRDGGGTPETPNQTNTTGTPQPPANPFAMFGGQGAAGAAGNPFAALFGNNPAVPNPTPSTSSPPPASGEQTTSSQGTTTGSTGANPPNPFSMLFNPAMMGQLPQQQGAAPSNPNLTPPQQPENPFASLQNNPFMQNPALLQQFMQAMGGGGGEPGSFAPPGGGNPEAFNNAFASLFPQGTGTGSPPRTSDTRPPEERYAEQLRQLNDMGFYEFERNIEALRRTGGSVQGAVEYLLSHP